MRNRCCVMLLGLGLTLLWSCAGEFPEGNPRTARAARADFDARCATRPPREVIESNLRELTGDSTVRTIERRDFENDVPWQLRPVPPGTVSALRGGGKRFGNSGFLGIGAEFVAAVAYLDGEGKILGCRSDTFFDGP